MKNNQKISYLWWVVGIVIFAAAAALVFRCNRTPPPSTDTDTTVVNPPPAPPHNIKCDQSFDWTGLSPELQDDLKRYEAKTPVPLDLTQQKVILLTEITNYENTGSTVIWVQVEKKGKWPVPAHNYLTTPQNIKN